MYGVSGGALQGHGVAFCLKVNGGTAVGSAYRPCTIQANPDHR
jgi:hypothetical protein